MPKARLHLFGAALAGLLVASEPFGSSGQAAIEPRQPSPPVAVGATGQDDVTRLSAAEARAKAAEARAARLRRLEISAVKKEQIAKVAAAAARGDAVAAQKRQAEVERLARQRQQAADARTARMRRLALWGGGGAALLLSLVLGGAGLLVQRQRSRRRRAEVEAKSARHAELQAKTPPAGARDVLLEGMTPDGETIAIKIPAIALGTARGGAVIGRSPEDSEFVINRQGVSRRHARLFVENEVLMIEDLKSTNGTGLNGTALSSASPLADGDQITLDELTLRLSFRGVGTRGAAKTAG